MTRGAPALRCDVGEERRQLAILLSLLNQGLRIEPKSDLVAPILHCHTTYCVIDHRKGNINVDKLAALSGQGKDTLLRNRICVSNQREVEGHTVFLTC